ncbi:cardiolipin synthase [Sphingopyxis sp. BSNA05]|uniref:cardiolipin synthase n=1 Tax=Sphingopyxis sp. BSNA05 TaxID=1236614 RepID=UPI0015646E78|nr:cardiolipin synthase [Sphingopyxis sp. BSNA05]NRD89072.1 cardiolipin synthase [Sphingopyxis sp. BSNA05]
MLFAHIAIVLTISLRILLREDLRPPARLAWLMTIFVLPYAGALTYFLFGEARFGKKVQKDRRSIIADIIEKGLDLNKIILENRAVVDPKFQLLARYATSINMFTPVEGNSTSLMRDAQDTVAHLVADIDNAKTHIHVLYYIWLKDVTGTTVAEALMRASRRGVTCRVMVDGLGSRAFIKSKLWQAMQVSGVRTQVVLSVAHPIKSALFSRIDLRNHRKITVIDNQITYCGSQNCADPEFLIKAEYAPWVDIMLRITGPVVAQNQLLFATDWMYYHPEDSLEDFSNPIPKANKGSCIAQVVGDGPTSRHGASSQLFTALVGSAHDTLTISTPYFVPDSEIVSSLLAAAHRGVKVSLIFPARNDSWIVGAVSRSYYKTLLSAGIRIYEYVPGLLHAKTLTIDSQITVVGSTNLDLRSFDLNYENDLLCYCARTAAAVQVRQNIYIDDSDSITLDCVGRWSIWRRIWQNAMATLGPVL